jgi:putative hydrolase of the HAD superfamily
MPSAIFFDMDDTLLDSSGAGDAAWTAVVADYCPRLGVAPETLRDAIRTQARVFWEDEAKVGHWRLDLVGARAIVARNALESLGLPHDHATAIAADYASAASERYQLFDDALETLEWLRAEGYRLGLITNGHREPQRQKIARFALEPYFDVVIVEGEFGAGKPEAAVFRHALQVTGAGPEHAWHIGDNLYADIGGAQAVGIHGVWIHRDRIELRDAHPTPDRVIGHLAELRAVLAR